MNWIKNIKIMVIAERQQKVVRSIMIKDCFEYIGSFDIMYLIKGY